VKHLSTVRSKMLLPGVAALCVVAATATACSSGAPAAGSSASPTTATVTATATATQTATETQTATQTAVVTSTRVTTSTHHVTSPDAPTSKAGPTSNPTAPVACATPAELALALPASDRSAPVSGISCEGEWAVGSYSQQGRNQVIGVFHYGTADGHWGLRDRQQACTTPGMLPSTIDQLACSAD
jgi:hypothetical protein